MCINYSYSWRIDTIHDLLANTRIQYSSICYFVSHTDIGFLLPRYNVHEKEVHFYNKQRQRFAEPNKTCFTLVELKYQLVQRRLLPCPL